jgi:NADPH-dependent ferric siderophore reductase
VRLLGPSFLRVTFTADDLGFFADNGADQRVKLLFPPPGADSAVLAGGEQWYATLRSLPDAERPAMRTYTVRAVRPADREVDVDFVLHGDGGPASAWAGRAAPGDRIVIVGPDGRWPGEHGGVEFRPPAGVPLLLAGDETAVPAICAILERLPADATGHVLLEVPDPADAGAAPAVPPPGVRVTWLARGDAPHGAKLTPAVAAAADALLPSPRARASDLDDPDDLWDVPPRPASDAPLYAWLAGEASVIRGLRRHLVTERGLDRRWVAFMGYWRHGATEN